MIHKFSIAGLIVLLTTTLSVAQDFVYLNVYDNGAGDVFVSQTNQKCDSCQLSKIVQYQENTANELASALKSLWTADENVGSFNLMSDLDFGQISAKDACLELHTPLTFKAKGGFLNGNGHTVKNLCYAYMVNYGTGVAENDARMPSVVGLFDSLQNVTASNLFFENVFLEISNWDANESTSLKGNWYRPIGTLAGVVSNSNISNIRLKNVSVSGPMAGGVVGLARNSSFENIQSEGVVDISNVVGLDKTKGQTCPGPQEWCGLYTVFLGGVVGYSVNGSFSDIDLSLKLWNNSQSKTATLGGLAGLIAVSGTSEESQAAEKPVVIDSVRIRMADSSIQGGFAMGGLVGAVDNYKSEMVNVRNVEVLKSSFSGSLSKAQGDSVFVGGLIGRSVTQGNVSFKVQECTAGVSIVDDPSRISSHRYYAGGLVGFGPWGVSSGDINTGLSIVKSSSVGKIDLVESQGIQVPEAIISVGGLVGRSIFALNGNAVFGSRAEMDLNVNLSYSDETDEVYVGGLVGVSSVVDDFIDSSYNVRFHSSNFEGNIQVDGVNGASYVGGILGLSLKTDKFYGVAMEQVRVRARENTLVSLNVNNVLTAPAYVAAGGLCGLCKSLTDVNGAAVNGGLVVGGNLDMADSIHVGGLVGRAWSTAKNFTLTNSYHIGNLVVESPALPDSLFVGYLVGKLAMRNHTNLYKVVSNYHYGSDSYDAFGSYFMGNNSVVWNNVVDVCQGISQPGAFCWNIQNTVRNGFEDSLSSTRNGTLLPQSMKTPAMVDFLKEPWKENNLWDFDYQKNDSLPFLKDVESFPEVIAPDSSKLDTSVVDSFVTNRFVGWHMVSLTGLEKHGVKPNTEDPIYWWNELNAVGEFWQYQVYAPGDNVEDTKGFWVRTADDLSVEEADAEENREIVWNVDSAYSGWNLVANPYGWTVDVTDIDNLEPENIWRYDEKKAEYVNATELKPFEAAWIKTNAFKTLRFDAKVPVSDSNRTLRKFVTAASDGWTLRAILTDEYGKQDSWNVMGASSQVVQTEEPPAGMNDHVQFSIMEKTRALAKSLKPETETMEWTVVLGASTMRDGYLKMEGVEQLNRQGKHVYVTMNGRTFEMKERDSLKVALKRSSTAATVTVSPERLDLFLNPLGKPNVVRRGNLVHVGFDVAAELADNDVVAELYNASGVVVSKTMATSKSGSNNLSLDLPGRGVYVVRLRVGSQSATKVFSAN